MKTLISLIIILSNALAQAETTNLVSTDRVTLAQILVSDKPHTLLILEDNGTTVDGIDLNQLFNTNAKMLDIYHNIGFDELIELSLSKGLQQKSYSIAQLLSPAGIHSHHIAVGLNYGKHADEVENKHQPFLFVKMAKPTRQQSITVSQNELLDYEVELCARPLTTLTDTPREKEPAFGFFLCGDFTDRAELLRSIDTDNLQSGRGFSKAKSKPDYFPTGPYLVISRHWQDFINKTELSLSLNGNLKQKTKANQMIWPLSRILEEIQHKNKNSLPLYTDKAHKWLPKERLTSDITILTGTPDGVIFRPPTMIFKIQTAIKFLFTKPLSEISLKNFVLEQYIQHLLIQQSFLKPKDQLVLNSNYLGKIQLEISTAN